MFLFLPQSTVKVLFHDRRLQFMEKEQIDSWKQMRPGERILDIGNLLPYCIMQFSIEFKAFVHF